MTDEEKEGIYVRLSMRIVFVDRLWTSLKMPEHGHIGHIRRGFRSTVTPHYYDMLIGCQAVELVFFFFFFLFFFSPFLRQKADMLGPKHRR